MTNRDSLRALIESAGITQKKAAELIGRQRGYPLDERTVRRWLADPDTPSARHCPDWAQRLLADALKARKKKARN